MLLRGRDSRASSPYSRVALGAILSPTDAVATSIVKRLGISRRVVTLLEGESLLNDATALVLLRTMIAAAALALPATTARRRTAIGSFRHFLWGVLVAVVVGALVGLLNLRLRALMHNSAANTAVGFVVPFVAYLPTEQLGGSGLVAAVVAGIVTGQGAARWFTPEQRLSDDAELAHDRARARGRGVPADGARAQGDRRPEPRDSTTASARGIGLALAALADHPRGARGIRLAARLAAEPTGAQQDSGRDSRR